MTDFSPQTVSFKEKNAVKLSFDEAFWRRRWPFGGEKTAFPIFQTCPSIILNTIANIAIVLNIYVDMLLFGTRFYEAEKSIYEGKSFND